MHKIVLEIRLIIKKCVQDVLGKTFEETWNKLILPLKKFTKIRKNTPTHKMDAKTSMV